MVLGVRAREGGPAACVCWSLLSIGNLSLSKPRGRGTKQEKDLRPLVFEVLLEMFRPEVSKNQGRRIKKRSEGKRRDHSFK